MRITTKTLSRRFMSNLNTIYDNVSKYHTQVHSGQAFQKPSEDPINATRSMDVSSKIKRAEQHGTNIQEAYSIFREAEVSLRAVSDSLTSIKNDLLKALNGSYNNEDKAIVAEKVENMRDNIISQLNKEYAGKYIFGGFNTFDKPFKTVAGVTSYNGLDLETITPAEYDAFLAQEMTIQTGKATEVDTAIPGIAITGHGPDNLISVLNRICTNLRDPAASRTELEGLVDTVDNYFRGMQNHISTIGTKAGNLETLREQNEGVVDNLEELLSNVAGVDYEQAVVNFKTAEMVYNSALAIGAKIIQPTLIDFIR